MIILASHLANWIRATESTLDRGLLETSAAIVNTAAILIFTLTLIPFQQYAASYSPLLLRYVRSDWRIVVSYSAFLLLILVSLGLLFCPLTFATAVTASACVLLSFLLVGATSFWSADLLDPRRVLPRIEVAVERALSGAIRHYRRQPRVLTADELREIMRQVLNTNDNQHAEATLLSVPIAQLQPAMSSLRTLQQLSAVFLRAGQVELFDAAYQTQLRCLRTYLTLRSDFVSNTDHLMITTADVIRDYAVIVRQVGNTHQSRTIWRGAAALAIDTLRVPVIGAEQGHHHLAQPLTMLLRESIAEDIGAGRGDSAFEAIQALGAYATSAGARGQCHTSSQLIEALSEFARHSAAGRMTVATWCAKEQMAAASYATIRHRRLVLNYDYPFRRIVEAYEAVLGDPRTENTPGLPDPVTWWDPDISVDRSISALVKECLFPDTTDDVLVQHNLALAGRWIALLQRHHGRRGVIQASANIQLYQCGLWITAFLDPRITLEMVVDRTVVAIPSSGNRDRALLIIGALLDWMVGKWFQYVRREDPEIMDGDELLASALSIYAILCGCDTPHELNLDDWLSRSIGAHLLSAIEALPAERLSDEDWVSISNFVRVLRSTGKAPMSRRRLAAIVRWAGTRHAGGMALHAFVHIKRPPVTFRQDLFAHLDELAFASVANSP